MREAIKQRTAASKTFSMGGGQFRTEYFSYPVHYLCPDGKRWEEIDTNIVKSNDWEFTNGVTANRFNTYFGDRTSENTHLYGVAFKNGGEEHWINFKLKGAQPAYSEASGSSCRFVECFDSVDVAYDVFSDSVKETIWLKKQTPLKEFVFTVKAGGMRLAVDSGGFSIQSEDGCYLWRIDKPYMEDSAGSVSHGVEYRIGHDGSYPTLAVVVTDEAFLKNAVYPVGIDPSITIEDGEGFRYYQNNSTQGAGMMGASAQTYRLSSSIYYSAFDQLKADLAKGVTLVNAYLDLYCTSTTPPNDVRFGNGGAVFYTIAQPWAHGTAPPESNAKRVTQVTTPGATGKWHRINLLNFIDTSFHGLRMVAGDNYTRAIFASPTHSNATLRPKLVLQYLLSPVLGFHDGTGIGTHYYSDGYDNSFKLLDFGTLVAGQVSLPVKVYIKNLAGFEVTNLRVLVSPADYPEKTAIEISQFNSPFIPEDTLRFNGVFADGDEAPFYVRIVTKEDTMLGGDFYIYAKADPY